MQSASKRNSLGRRSFLGTSALTLLAMSSPVLAQRAAGQRSAAGQRQPQAEEPPQVERQGEARQTPCA